MNDAKEISRKAQEIADKYLSQIRFTASYFCDSDASPFPAVLHLEIPTTMLKEYASIKSVSNIPEYHDESREFLTRFWKETGLAEKLRSHEKVRVIPERSDECPIDMLDYLAGEDVYVNLSEIPDKRDLQSARIEIDIRDMSPEDEDDWA